jgi:hypothetical protein
MNVRLVRVALAAAVVVCSACMVTLEPASAAQAKPADVATLDGILQAFEELGSP